MLEIETIRAGYGAITVLWDLSLTIEAGRTTAIIGPNGAGKTTLLRAIMGLIPAEAGDIRLDGTSLGRTPTWDRVTQGLVMIPEGRLVFRDMTVEDNLLMGAYPRGSRARAKPNLARIYAMFPRLKERQRQMAGSLSGGEAQMLAIGRGLMEEPKILLIDEPSLGLAPVMVDEVFAIIRQLKGDGMTIVLVEQNTHRTVAVADTVHLMRAGQIALSQAACDIDLDKLHAVYFADTPAT